MQKRKTSLSVGHNSSFFFKTFQSDATLFSDLNNLKCIVRSHAEIREGCGLSHEGCYTVYSAPNQVQQIISKAFVLIRLLTSPDQPVIYRILSIRQVILLTKCAAHRIITQLCCHAISFFLGIAFLKVERIRIIS